MVCNTYSSTKLSLTLWNFENLDYIYLMLKNPLMYTGFGIFYIVCFRLYKCMLQRFTNWLNLLNTNYIPVFYQIKRGK